MSLPSITAFPTAPSRRDDPDTYVTRADAFVGALGGFVTEMNAVITAIPGIVTATNYNATSTTSLTIGTGSKTFTVATGGLWQVGMFMIAASTASPANYMAGQVTSYNSSTGALTINVTTTGGSGTIAAWTITPSVVGSISSLAAIASSGSGADLTSSSVTYAKLQNASAASVLLGRGQGGGAGVLGEITLGTNISMTGNVLNVSSGTATVANGDYGDITVTSSGTVWTIDPAVVTYSKIQNVSATDKLLGRATAGAGSIEEIACTSVARTFLAQSTQALLRSTGLGLGSIATFAEGTTAEFRANTSGKALSTDKVWAAADLVTLTDAATVAVDMSALINATITLAGNRTLGNPTNTKNGQCGMIVINQDTTGSRTLAYSSNWKFASGTAPVLTTAANARDLLFYQVISSTVIYATLVKDVK